MAAVTQNNKHEIIPLIYNNILSHGKVNMTNAIAFSRFPVHGQRPLQRPLLQHHAERLLLDHSAVRQERPQPVQG